MDDGTFVRFTYTALISNEWLNSFALFYYIYRELVVDYEFILDTNTKAHIVEVAGEQYAVGRFLNNEFGENEGAVKQLNELIDKLEVSSDGVIQFTEWCIEIDADELTIFHSSQLEAKSEQDKATEIEQSLSDVEWDFQSECGKADLIELLISWADFRA